MKYELAINLKTAKALWPAPGSEDTKLGVLMELEVNHGEDRGVSSRELARKGDGAAGRQSDITDGNWVRSEALQTP